MKKILIFCAVLFTLTNITAQANKYAATVIYGSGLPALLTAYVNPSVVLNQFDLP